jgi:hypothetical protein
VREGVEKRVSACLDLRLFRKLKNVFMSFEGRNLLREIIKLGLLDKAELSALLRLTVFFPSDPPLVKSWIVSGADPANLCVTPLRFKLEGSFFEDALELIKLGKKEKEYLESGLSKFCLVMDMPYIYEKSGNDFTVIMPVSQIIAGGHRSYFDILVERDVFLDRYFNVNSPCLLSSITSYSWPISLTIYFKRPLIFDALMRAGVSIDTCMERFPLATASRRGNLYCVDALLLAGASPNERVNAYNPLPPLLMALQSGFWDVAYRLLQANAAVNETFLYATVLFSRRKKPSTYFNTTVSDKSFAEIFDLISSRLSFFQILRYNLSRVSTPLKNLKFTCLSFLGNTLFTWAVWSAVIGLSLWLLPASAVVACTAFLHFSPWIIAFSPVPLAMTGLFSAAESLWYGIKSCFSKPKKTLTVEEGFLPEGLNTQAKPKLKKTENKEVKLVEAKGGEYVPRSPTAHAFSSL